MAKSWADMSKDERSKYEGKKAYNKQHGLERYAEGGVLEHKSDTYVPPSPANSNANNQNNSGSSSSSNSTSSSTSNSSSSSSSSSAATPHQTQNRQQAVEKAQNYQTSSSTASKSKEQQQHETFMRAQSYLDNHPNKGRGSVRDAGYEQILREGGLSNHQFQEWTNANRKEQYDQNQYYKKHGFPMSDEKKAFIEAQKNAGVGNVPAQFTVNQQSYYQDQFNKTGRYHQNEARNNAIKGLMGTGLKFSTLDIERELGAGSNHGFKGLYGNKNGMEGFQDYQTNHSVASGNFGTFTDQSKYVEKQDVIDQRNSAIKTNYDFYNDELINNQFGQYDWFQEKKTGATNAYNNQYL